jgi:hypothetical protein
VVAPSRIELELSVSETDVLSVTPWDLFSETLFREGKRKMIKEKALPNTLLDEVSKAGILLSYNRKL